jgi:hypothetical protein
MLEEGWGCGKDAAGNERETVLKNKAIPVKENPSYEF